MKTSRTKTDWLVILAFVVFNLVFLGSAKAQLSGTYTIDAASSASRNYTSFSNAISALKSQGVSNSVVFEIADGSYNEIVDIRGNINGLSGSRRVSFLGASKDSSSVTIKGSSQFQLRIEISNLIFKHIGIETSHVNGRAVFINDANLINIENCHIAATGFGNTSGVFSFESDNITLKNNFIAEAYYGIYASSSYRSLSLSNNYSNNTIPSYRNAGMFFIAHEGIEINENVIGGKYPNNVGKGIYLSEVSKGIVERNIIIGGKTALEIASANRALRNAKDSLRCINNYLEISGAAAAFVVNNSERVNLYHNTVVARNSDESLFLDDNDDFSIVNNHFVADSCKFGIYLDQDSTTNINFFDYNVYSFNSCNKFGFYNAVADSFRNFKLLDTLSNLNSTATNQSVVWLGGRPLGLAATNNVAKYIGINNDFYGNTRPLPTDTGVDVGCYEYKLDTIGLAIASLISPEALSLTSNKVSCKLVNSGTHNIYNKTFRIAYSIDKTTWVYDSLKIDTILSGEAIDYSFAKRFNLAFPTDISLQIVIDNWPTTNTGIATESRTFDLCFGLLDGTYNIGKTADYKTINEAINALSCGIAGSVVFEIEDGVYDEEIVLRKTPGASSTRTISFISKSRKASKVKIESSSLYVIDFLAAQHVLFKNVTVISKHNANGIHSTVRITARSNRIQFDSCIITGPVGRDAFGVHIKNADSSLFSNCKIYGGKVGLVIEGNRMLRAPSANSISHSEIKFFRSGAFVANYSKGTSIISSVIDSSTADTTSGFLKDVEFFHSTEINFQQNKIFSNCIALNLQDCEHPSNGYSLFASNQFISKGYSSLVFNKTDSIRFLHNTILHRGEFTGVRVTNGLNHRWLYNNIIVDGVVDGISLEMSGNSLFDFNNLYIKNCNKPIVYNGQGFQNNQALKSALGINRNGFGTKPYFKDYTELKHHSALLNNAAKKSISVIDIDGNLRPSIADGGIDIGAFEVALVKHSLEIRKLLAPASVSSNGNTVEVLFENNGTDSFINSSILVRYSGDSGKTYYNDTLRISHLAPGTKMPYSFGKTWIPTRNGKFQLTIEILKALSNEKIKPTEKEYNLCSGIEGNYTIGATGDYNTVKQAIKALGCGITGPVIFTLEDGTYREQIKIGNIEGTSSANTVTFKGTRKAIIEYHGASSTDRYCISFDNASYVNFEGITLTGLGAFASGVLFYNNSHHNSVRKVFFNFKAYATQTTNVAIAFSNDLKNSFSSRNGSYNLIDSNEFIGSYYGVRLFGAVGFGCRGNVLSNNTFNRITNSGIELYSDDSTQVLNNTFLDSVKSIDYCIRSSNSSNFVINGNKLHGRNTIEIGGANQSNKAFSGTIFNNQVVQVGSGNWITLAQSQNVDVIHNSVLTGSTLLYEYQSDSIVFANNSIYTTGFSAMVATPSDFIFWDNNNYYKPQATYLGNFNGQNVNSLQDLAKYTFPHNQRCFSQDPKYVSTNNLHLTKASPKLTGKYLGIDFDIDGDARCKVTPMIGMDEKGLISVTPSANFSLQDTLVKGYIFTVKNTGTITGSEIISWYLNDTLISNAQNLSFTPTWFGLQKITLVHTTCSSADTITDSFLVTDAYKAPIANFTTNRKVFSPGENIRLFDNSQYHPKEFSWSISPIQNTVNSPGYFDRTHYWDPIKDSSTQNPAVVIYYTGKYTVCLKVKNKMGQDSICKTDYLEIREHNTICRSFYSSERHGRIFDSGGEKIDYQAGRSCSFYINTCEGHIAVDFESLDLGDGDYLRIYEADNRTPLWNSKKYPKGITGNKTDTSFPKKVVATSGAVRIHFSADSDVNTVGKGFVIDWDVINDSLDEPTALFSAPDSICVGTAINLINLSKNAYENEWDFDSDGIIDRTAVSPVFKRDSAASYRIFTTAKGFCNQTDTFSKTTVVIDSIRNKSIAFKANSCFLEIDDTLMLSDLSNGCNYNNVWRISTKGDYPLTVNRNQLSALYRMRSTGYKTNTLLKVDTFGNGDSLVKQNSIYVGAYCGSFLNGSDEQIGITKVEFANISKKTSTLDNYNIYKADTVKLEPGNSYELKIYIASKQEKSLYAWIDWNGDYDFDDRGELLIFEENNTQGVISTTVKVPENAVLGKSRLRITSSSVPTKNAYCLSVGKGETEDYRVYLGSIKDGYPQIRLLGNINDTLNLDSTFAESGFIALDNEDGNLTSKVVVSGYVDSSKAGLYTLVYSVSDSDNNTSTAIRKVRVMDFEAPSLSLIDGDKIYTELNYAFIDPGYTVLDNLDPNPKVEIIGKIDTSVFGEQVLKYCATDASGNKVCVKRIVTVGDTTRPIISLLGSDSVYIEVYDSSYNDAGYVYNDNDSANITARENGDWKEQFGELGTYTLTYLAIDRKDNRAKTSRTITVGDTTKPTINLIGASKVTVERWSTYKDSGFTYFDNYFDTSDVDIAIGGTFINTQSLGKYTLIYWATDPKGNVGEVIREIEVVQPSSIRQAELLNVSIYPNPVKTTLTLSAPSFVGESYVLQNAYGQEISSDVIRSKQQEIITSQLSYGIYFLNIDGLKLRFVKVE